MPVLPGLITRAEIDVQITVSGQVTYHSTFAEDRTFSGSFRGPLFNDYSLFYGKCYAYGVGGLLVPAGQSVTVPAFGVCTFSYSWDGFVPGQLSLHYYEADTGHLYGPWNVCTLDGQTCSNYWSYELPATYDLDWSYTAEMRWEWLPTLDTVQTVCDGDGIIELDLVGEWGQSVLAYSDYALSHLMVLFIGDYYPPLQSNFCIGPGARINSSLSTHRIYHTFPLSTLIVGKTYTLQAAHRYNNQPVRFSNALQFTPM